MVQLYRAAWVLPIARPPIRDGWIAVEAGRVVSVGGPDDAPPASNDVHSLGAAAVLPGLVNAHTHLELSYLARRVPPAASFSAWIRGVMSARRQYPDPEDPEILDAARRGIASARASGTILFGDISNTLVTVPLLREAGMPAQVFYELLGFNVADPQLRVAEAAERASALSGGDLRVAIAPHAPYSVSPPLFAAMRASLDASTNPVTSVHLGESRDETEFVRHGTGDIRRTLEDLGVWTDEWRALLPAGESPVGYLSKLGFLNRSTLVVHGVQFDRADRAAIRALGVTLVSCPRSNIHVGAGEPPLDAFYREGLRVAFGTDSLASVADLNLFAEIAAARRLAPDVPAARLLESATRIGAEALGFGAELGTIEPGKRAALIGVRIPEDVPDVEEYLVSGVPPDAIRWVNS